MLRILCALVFVFGISCGDKEEEPALDAQVGADVEIVIDGEVAEIDAEVKSEDAEVKAEDAELPETD